MVATRLLALAAALALLPFVAESWSRYRGLDRQKRLERGLIRTGGSMLLLALVGFEGVFGLVSDPDVPNAVATATTLGLYTLALACFFGAFWLRRRD